MAFWQTRDFRFCGVCGTLLNFNSLRSASCHLCGFKPKDKDIEGKETRYAITAEDRIKELKIQPFVDVVGQRPVVEVTCPNCMHPKLEFIQMQLRSADEGAPTFYDCPECGYKFSENKEGEFLSVYGHGQNTLPLP